MSAEDNLTKYVGVPGGSFGLPPPPQDQSALYNCNSTGNANKMICKAKLNFSLFQGPS